MVCAEPLQHNAQVNLQEEVQRRRGLNLPRGEAEPARLLAETSSAKPELSDRGRAFISSQQLKATQESPLDASNRVYVQQSKQEPGCRKRSQVVFVWTP